jgi:hypothetical protein
VVPKSTSLPGDDRLRPHDDERFPPSPPVPGDLRPEKSIGRGELRPPSASLKHGQLMSKGEDLDLHGGAGPEEGGEESEDGAQNGHHGARPVGRAEARALARRRGGLRQPVQVP